MKWRGGGVQWKDCRREVCNITIVLTYEILKNDCC